MGYENLFVEYIHLCKCKLMGIIGKSIEVITLKILENKVKESQYRLLCDDNFRFPIFH
jgi:hypothetical protein